MIVWRKVRRVLFCPRCQSWANGRRWRTETGLCPACQEVLVQEAGVYVPNMNRNHVYGMKRECAA